MGLETIDGRLVVTIDVDEDGYFDRQNAALFIGRSPGYVRTLAKKGSLDFVTDDEGNMLFHQDTLEAYNAKPRHGGRTPGEIPYKTLSSSARRLRSVIRMVEAADIVDEHQSIALGVLQGMLDADIAENVE